jgi:hypothetical protein
VALENSIKSGVDSFARAANRIANTLQNPKVEYAFSIARVTFVLLDNSNKEKFDKYGGWKSLGLIECAPFINNNFSTDVISALPINPNVSQFPIVNEVVLLIRSITYEAQSSVQNYLPQYYYINVIPVWNSTEHNSIPNDSLSKIGVNPPTSLFKETGKIKRVIKAPGDISIEGRSGNYIRLGSTISGFNSPYSGENRSPVVAIINSQRDVTDSKIAIYEDINLDGSSLYMLDGQSVALKVASPNFDSYKHKIDQNPLSNYIEPTIPKETKPDNLADIKDDPPPVIKEITNVNKKEDPKIESNQKSDEFILEENKFAEQPFDLTEGGDIVPFEAVDEVSVFKESTVEEEDKVKTNTGAPKNNSPLSSYIDPKVKWQAQPAGSTWCYVTTISMVLNYYGISNATQRNVSTCNDKNGNMRSETVASRFGVNFKKTILPSGKVNSYEELKRICKSRKKDNYVKPFILERASNYGYKSHFVTVVGITDDDKIIVFDPGSKRFAGGTILNIKNLKESGGSVRFFDK